MHPRPAALAFAVMLGLAAPPLSAAGPHDDADDSHARELDEVVVTATPLRQAPDEVARPLEVLAGPALDDRRAGTLGESVARLPGVQSSFFGAGVGRPVIRGLDGARVQVLGNGLAAMDVSTVSVDHAVAIDPFLAEQIEVLKGPATLLFGSGAVGGAVNVVDGRIHDRPFEGVRGRAELRGNDVADERGGAARIDLGGGRFVLHADAFHRDADDYAIPGQAERGAEHGDAEHPPGVLPNSAVRTTGGALGFSLAGGRGFAGLSLSRHESRYGVPGHAHHAHGGGHDDDGHDHDHDHDHTHGEVVIDLRQTRIEAAAGVDDPLPGHESLRLRLGEGRYTHTEFEDGLAGTRFDNEGREARLELVHAPLAGWRGAWGVQGSRRDFTAVGEEAFVPPSLTRDLGLFVLERREWDRLSVELGARADHVRVRPRAQQPARRFNAFSASLAGEWRFAAGWHLRLGLDRAERAPTAEELYSDGLHVATAAYETGNVALDTETARQAELGLHYHGDRVELRVAAWRNRFDGFIFLDHAHGDEAHDGGGAHGHEGVPALHWHQHDATLRGTEAEARLTLADGAAGIWRLHLLADAVRGDLHAGGPLPRMAPDRYGTAVEWSLGGWRARAGALRHRAQTRVADGETPTPGHTLLEADVAYSFEWRGREVEAFVQGRNLGNADIRVHTSFLKDLAPQPGRTLAAGLRAWF